MHAELAGEILTDVGHPPEVIDRVGALLRKRDLKTDAEAQALEDVACLVFLEHYLEPFAADHEDDKVVSILRKTWPKMSPAAHEAALVLPLGDRMGCLVAEALNASAP
jgi:hypothetical protein